MLRELRISNFAIIDGLELTFATGLNVLTGETGAGKSIITRAIGLLCGERAASDFIRGDAEEAAIEGRFELAPGEAPLLAEIGLAVADELLIRRVIARAGKGRISINGALATAAMLAQLGDRLIHVYGQHEQALLLKPDNHLDFLDEFARFSPLRGRMQGAYQAARDAAERLATLVASGEAGRQRLELVRFQVQELRDAAVRTGEEADLLGEREVQRHAEKLATVCRQGEEVLYSGDDAVGAALARVAQQVAEAARIAPSLASVADLLRQAAAQTEDAALELRRAGQRIRSDPERLEELEERLQRIARLKRKYDCEADTLPLRLQGLEAELVEADGVGLDVGAARQIALDCAGRAWEIARELSRARQGAAAGLEQRMAPELATLGMADAALRVIFAVTATDGPQSGSADPATNAAAGLTATGGDVVQFYLSANPGESPKPLARIASGGELSRIMLALKTLTVGAGEVSTLIFDEVDAGIGGAVAEAVGKRLHALAEARQLLCITHLPQIAAQADHHFAVEKAVSQGRTTTTARLLEGDERVRELMRMLGGSLSQESQRFARRLMEESQRAPARRRPATASKAEPSRP